MSTSNSPSASQQGPPPAGLIFIVYSILGAILSFAFGRDPSSSDTLLISNTNEFVREVSPTFIVICLFLVSYSLFDVMGVGVEKSKHGLLTKTYPANTTNPPESVYIAQRIQTNQVEQLPGFLIASISFTILVNGKVGAFLSLVWAVLRRLYAAKYNSSVGKAVSTSGIATFTIPAYFALNSMLMGTVVHCVRILVKSS